MQPPRHNDALKKLHDQYGASSSLFDTPSKDLEKSWPAVCLSLLTPAPSERPTVLQAMHSLRSLQSRPRETSPIKDARVRRLKRKTSWSRLPSPQKLSKPFAISIPGEPAIASFPPQEEAALSDRWLISLPLDSNGEELWTSLRKELRTGQSEIQQVQLIPSRGLQMIWKKPASIEHVQELCNKRLVMPEGAKVELLAHGSCI